MRMRYLVIIVVVACISIVSFARVNASETCRQISNRKERDDCYAHQEAVNAVAKPKRRPSKMDTELDRLRRENDLMTHRLRSICKGC